MSEPLPEGETAEAPGSYGRRLFVTAILLALYVAAHRIGLPLVHAERLPFVSHVPLTLLTLGLKPLVTGFLLVEVFSLMTASGRRLRAGGAAGRARLNRAAVVTSLVTSAVQAPGIALFLEAGSTTFSAPVVDQPGWLFRLLLTATLTAMTAALFVLGNLLSEYGIGNGFALLVLTEIGWSALGKGMAVRMELSEDTLPPAVGIFVTAGLVALLIRFIRAAEATWIPPFPQGNLPLGWTLAILWIPWIEKFLSSHFQLGSFNLPFLVATPLGVVLFSWLTFEMFSSRPRLEANLPEPAEVIDRIEDLLERRLNPSTALLALGTTGLFAWNAWQPHSWLSTTFTFLDLLLVVIIALDLHDQYRFLRRHGQVARLVQLDNVHLSYRLAARLREEGIDVLARAQRLRSLCFFFGALIKIDVLVPWEQRDRAREVWDALVSAPPIIF
ncbi:MAG TPA: hypothetical protein VEW48_19820 [Thermoanaerobaculia bacterium]|nr:hypothetical protein [Thermoanaerobaculia bacterium]